MRSDDWGLRSTPREKLFAGNDYTVSKSALHRFERESGIPEETSDRWDKTLERWFG